MLTERSIINFLIWTGGLIAGPYLATTAISGNFNPLFVVLGVTAVVLLFGVWRDNICILPYIATYCGGRFNMLPLKLSPTELAVLGLICYYAIAYLALKRRRVHTGPLMLFVPIVVIALIILHNEHNFGLRELGTGREGGRKAFFILVAALAYICGVGVNTPSTRVLAYTPALCTIGSALFAIPYILTTYVPQFAPYVYLISDNINTSAYASDILNSDETVRNQGQALVGWNIFACLMVYFPFTTWLRPSRWWIIITVLGCSALVVMSGFRSVLVEFILMIGILAWCYVRWRAVLFVPAFLLGLALVVFLHNDHLIQLPDSAQRTLAFLPGDWNPEVVQNTDASSYFRRNIIQIYLNEYAGAHPWIGNGLSYDSADFDQLTYLARYHETPDGYYEGKEFIVSKQFHTGWLSLYDALGIIGGLCFISLFLTLIVLTGRGVLPRSVDRTSIFFPLKAWLFAFILEGFISFFTLFGDVSTTFTTLCYASIIWFQLNRIEKGIEMPASVRPIHFDAVRPRLPAVA